jgi:hypothetical protein
MARSVPKHWQQIRAAAHFDSLQNPTSLDDKAFNFQ